MTRNRRLHTLFVSTSAGVVLTQLAASAAAEQLFTEDVRIQTGNTPQTILEQTEGGFGAQTWVVGGNEANFFVREPNTGVRPPFRIKVGAPQNSLYVGANGNVGIGVGDLGGGSQVNSKLHVKAVTGAKVLVENTPSPVQSQPMFEIKNNGGMSFQMTNTNATPVSTWKFVAATESNSPTGADSFRISKIGIGPILQVFDTGDATLQGTLTENSDVNAKQDIEAVNQQSILEKVRDLPISEWSYKTAPASRHIGPMAQDFYQAFQLGSTDKGISSIDTGGVALAAIQALTLKLEARDEEVYSLAKKNRALQAQLHEQEDRVQFLELAVAELLNRNSPEQKIGSVE